MPDLNTADHASSTSDIRGYRRRHRAQYVELPHTGMRVPHNRLGIGSLATVPTHNGKAVHADLLLDGEPVATIVNNGSGRATELFSPNDKFGWERMRDYAQRCQARGGPLPEETVLDRLIDEHQQADLISRAATNETVLRLLNLDGDLDHALIIDGWSGPMAEALPRKVTDYLHREHGDRRGGQWQWWDGRRWHPLHVARMAHTA